MGSIQMFLRHARMVKYGIGPFWEMVWISLDFFLNLEELDT